MISQDNGIIIKNEEQIAGIRASSKLAASCLNFIEPHIQPGVTTLHLDKLLEAYMRDNNAVPAPLHYEIADHPPYPNATCIAVNEVVCHGVPNETELKPGDIVTVDVTTILNGYFGDTARSFAVGEVSADAQHVMKVSKKCLEIGIKQVYPGNRFGNIGYNILSYALLNGCSVVYQLCGHGVGLAFHEPPQVDHAAAKGSGELMAPGMIFTIEPMINLGVPEVIQDKKDGWTVRTKDGKLSSQDEHTVLVTANGVEVLTQ